MLRTTPALARTRRCLVTACRDRLVPVVSREMDCGLPLHSLVRTASRVASPRAANTTAGVFCASDRLRRVFDMLRDVLDLLAPTAVIHAECFEPALARELVETRLDDAQQGPRRDAVQRKLDECGRLAGIVLVRIDRIGVPGEREQPLGLHFLDHGLPSHMLIAGIGYLPMRDPPRHEGPVQPDAEPRAELVMIGQRSPDAGYRGL